VDTPNQQIIGYHVAAMYWPAPAPPSRKVIRLAPAKLDEYVGDYRLPTGELLRVSRTEDGIRLEGNIPLGPVVPEAPELSSTRLSGIARAVFPLADHGQD
jgi:hypothetical protein